jgi:hypothetical protein
VNDDLRRRVLDLVQLPAAPLVSAYVPVRTGPDGARAAQVRFKEMLRQAGRELTALQASGGMLAAGEALLDEPNGWQRRGTRVIFLRQDDCTHFTLPSSEAELLVVATAAHVKPLLPHMSSTAFHVLCLSQNAVRLIEATEATAREVELRGAPRSLTDLVGTQRQPDSLQRHGTHAAVVHGHGSGKDDVDAEVTRFVQAVDAALSTQLGNGGTPLVVAAVRELGDRFAHHSKLLPRIAARLDGNHDASSVVDLAAAARSRLPSPSDAAAESLRQRHHALLGTGRASNDLQEVLAAAAAGRVGGVLVASDRSRWGTLNGDGTTAERGTRAPGDVDLLDEVARRTLRQHGEALATPASQVPGPTGLAAVFRY